jgi:2-dehydro-3-deoxygluconokinase
MTKVISFGEIMMRLSPPSHQRFVQANSLEVVYGGADYNTAVCLSGVGIPSDFITRLPNNDFGQAALMDIKKNGLSGQHILFGGERLGLYFLENGVGYRASQVIYDRAHSSLSEIQPGMIDWETVFKDHQWFHCSGITPAISNNAAKVSIEAVKVAKEMGLKVSLDLNYRSKLWKHEGDMKQIMSQITSYVNVVLCTPEDAAIFYDIYPRINNPASNMIEDRIATFDSISDQLIAEFPNVSTVAGSIRETHSASRYSLSGVLKSNGMLCISDTYDMKNIVDRVGTGDALMGGIIYGLIKTPDNPQNTINFAVATSVLKHTVKGDVNYVTEQEVLSLVNEGSNGRIKR